MHYRSGLEPGTRKSKQGAGKALGGKALSPVISQERMYELQCFEILRFEVSFFDSLARCRILGRKITLAQDSHLESV